MENSIMSDEALNTIAEVLVEDAFGLTTLTAAGRQAANILQRLKARRIAVVELPEQMNDRVNVAESLRDFPMWELDGSWTCCSAPDCIEFEAAGQTEYGTLSVAEARSLAIALLSAVAAAEAVSS